MEESFPSWLISIGILVCIAGFLLFTLIYRIKRRRRYDLAKITLSDIDQMTGFEFEDYLYVLFAALEYEQTFMTKKSRDFGADLFFIDGENRRTVVQAKRLTEKLGLQAVQEVYTARAYYGAEIAIIITSTDLVSDPCRKLAAAAKVKIIDREKLKEIIALFKRGRLQAAKELVEEPYEFVEFNSKMSLEVIEQRRGIIQAGDYFYKLP
ncbi:restriction endonuclease [bacterium LRH843]|nr:restriction endonuclease [bacterium LRH843]